MGLLEAFMSLRGSPRELWVAYVLKVLESYAYFATSYILVLFLTKELGYSDVEASWAYATNGLLISIFGMVFGSLIDFFGVRWSLIVGSLIQAICRLLLSATSNSAVVYFTLYGGIPAGLALGIPVLTVGIRRYTSAENRSFAFSIFYVVMNVAALFASLFVDFFRTKVSDVHLLGYTFSPFRLLLLSSALMNFVEFIIALLFIREISVSDSGAQDDFVVKRESPWKSVGETVRTSRFWRFLLFVGLLIGVRQIFRHMDATFPKYMERELGEDVLWGSVVAINPAMIIILVPIVTVLTKRMKAFDVIQFGALITGVSPFWLVLGASYYTGIAFVVTLSLGEAIYSPRLMEYTTTVAPVGREGTYIALGAAPMFLTKFVVGGMSGVLLQEYCPEDPPRQCWVMWAIIGATTLSSGVLVTIFKRVITGGIDYGTHQRVESVNISLAEFDAGDDGLDADVMEWDAGALPRKGSTSSSVTNEEGHPTLLWRGNP